jgi:hypothetical protein
LRFGKKFGFDFVQNRDKKVGVLRCFVKEQKEKLKLKNGNMKMSSKMPLTSMICAETLEKNSSNYDGQELVEESPI